MSNTLYEDRQFLTLNILDEGMREGTPIEVATSLPAAHMIRMLEYAVAWRGQPQAIRLDNRLEIIAEHFMTGSAERAIEL